MRVDPDLGREVDRRLVDRDYPMGLVGLAAGAGSLWVASKEAGEVLRVDPANGHVQARIAMKSPLSLAYAAGAVWAVSDQGGLARIDAATNSVTATAPVPKPLFWVAAGGGRLDGERDQGHRLQGRPDGRDRGDVPHGRRRARQLRQRGAVGCQLRRRHPVGNRRGIRRRPHLPLRSPARRRRRRRPVRPGVHRRRPDGRGSHLGSAGEGREARHPDLHARPDRPATAWSRSRSRSSAPPPPDCLRMWPEPACGPSWRRQCRRSRRTGQPTRSE